MYKSSTPIYHIPYIADGEQMSESSEERAATIIENALFAGTCGVPDALFEDGEYTLHDMHDGTYTLIITASGLFTLCGIVNHRLFRTEEPVVFDGLEVGKQYLIYVCYQPELDTNPEAFTRTVTHNLRNGKKSVLLAHVDLTGPEPELNTDPEGKLYSKDVLQHSSDFTNPHGRNLIQDTLRVIKSLTVRGLSIKGSVYIRGKLPGFGGSVSYLMEHPIAHVSITPLESGAGNVWCNISGKKVEIYNNGDEADFSAEIRVG